MNDFPKAWTAGVVATRGGPMTLMARYSGECPECGERWQPGDLIRADEDRAWRHAVCPDASRPVIHPVCESCWLAHPEGECDR